MTQPLLNSSKGVVITIGLLVRGDRAAIVFPAATNFSLDGDMLCEAADTAVQEGLLPLLTPMLCDSCSVSHVQVVGMDNGRYPHRSDFAAVLFPGEEASDELPASIGGLAVFYKEFLDMAEGERLSHSKMTVPGLGESQITDGRLDDAYVVLLQALADAMRLGFSPSADPTQKWYRVMHAPIAPGIGQPAPQNEALARIGIARVRQYVGTQKRRLLPHY